MFLVFREPLAELNLILLCSLLPGRVQLRRNPAAYATTLGHQRCSPSLHLV